jgi:hypothetical protein
MKFIPHGFTGRKIFPLKKQTKYKNKNKKKNSPGRKLLKKPKHGMLFWCWWAT